MPTVSDPVEYFSQMQANEGWRVILESFARFVSPPLGASVLDVGTGPGALAYLFQETYGAMTWGVDIDPAMMHRAQQFYPQANIFISGGLPHLPFSENTFDYATATNVLYLMDDFISGFKEIARVLRVGGTLAMLNPSEYMTIESARQLIEEKQLTGFARENFIYWATMASQKPCWTENDVQELFAKAGIQLVETRLRIGQGLARYARGIKTEKFVE
jgi:ubiquinone/menaquinone biosynthesis C-methylase UbiE